MRKFLVLIGLLLVMVSTMGAACSGTMPVPVIDPQTGKPMVVNGAPVIAMAEVDYNTAIALTNMSRAANPRTAKVKFKPGGATEDVLLEIPMDSWQQPLVPESLGRQASMVLKEIAPGIYAWVLGDTLKAVANNMGAKIVNQKTEGPGSPATVSFGNGAPVTSPVDYSDRSIRDDHRIITDNATD